MDNPFPIPQQLRESDVFVGDGGQSYGPFDFKVFDIGDVEIWTRAAGDDFFEQQFSVLVAKTNGDPFDNFTITFPAGQPATTEIKVRSKRLDSRAAGVTAGTQIDPTAMEKEFSKISTEVQELRRDVDRTVNVPFGETPFQIMPGTTGQVPVFDANGNLIPSTPAGGGNMMREIYDPQNIAADVFDRANHTGEQAISTVIDLQTTLTGLQNDITSLGVDIDNVEAGIPAAIDAKVWRKALTDYGAVGDGVTDDTAAVVAAFAAGVPLTGKKKTYAVGGNVSIPSNVDFEDATLKQLTPNDVNRKTLYANGVSNVRLRRIKVDRNGNGTYGSLNGAGGIWIEGGSGHLLEDCEVFGSDIGTGIVFSGCTDFQAVRLYVHDILYVSAGLPADDQAQGIWFSNCQRWTVHGCKIRHIGGIVGGSYRRAFGRMMPIGLGCKSFLVLGNQLSDGDQGIDMTGSVGNQRFTLMGNIIEDVETWGIKLANYNRFGHVVGNNVYRAGSAAFVGSGPTLNVDAGSPTPESLPIHVLFEANGAWDTGFGNTGRGTSNPAGFLVMPGGASNFQDYPRGYRFVNCVAYDNQAVKTQKNGFRNEISYGGVPLNECINCRAGGFAAGGAGFSGWHFPMAAVSRSTAQVLTNNVAGGQEITFDTERSDGAAMHDPAVPGRINVPRAGFYLIKGKGTFQQNATGMRSLTLTLNGVAQAAINDVQPGSSANDTTCSFSDIVYIGDLAITIGMNAYQNAGGNLNISNCTLTVAEVMPNQVAG